MTVLLVTQPGAPDLPQDYGAKARHLQLLARAGIRVPASVLVPAQAYTDFVALHGLGPQIAAFVRAVEGVTRWEEVWEAALQLRSRFMAAPIPAQWLAAIEAGARSVGPGPWAVRSCALEEDGRLSHAGLHDSVLGVDALGLERAVRQVWASLWSDRAVLYRTELGLDAATSAMAVLLQPMVAGRVSGVLFTANPMHEGQLVIEAAVGGVQAVVEDTAPLFRVVVDREQGEIRVRSGESVLLDEEVAQLVQMGLAVEHLLGAPQDVEWTWDDAGVVVLQARPITSLRVLPDAQGWRQADKRPWYLSLTRTHANLERLHQTLTTSILPAMEAEAVAMPAVEGLVDAELLSQIHYRQKRLQFWEEVYFRHCIPLAHAVRQLGTLVADVLAPKDPFAFLDLLRGTDLAALRRNEALFAMARQAAADPAALAALGRGEVPPLLAEAMAAFQAELGNLLCATSWCEEGDAPLARFIAMVATQPQPRQQETRSLQAHDLEAQLLAKAPHPHEARAILDLARAAYALRDNDNLVLGRLRERLAEAEAEARRRGLSLAERAASGASGQKGGGCVLRGTPAAPGVAHGMARVVRSPQDVWRVQPGEVLVCDALDPTMTFAILLVAGIVERRGGMLVHGAIIAREYGIPCVTGIPEVVDRIPDGEHLMVDGFRGEVRLGGCLDPSAPFE